VVQIVTLSSSLTDTGEDGVTTVCLGDVVDQFLNQDGLTDTGTTEQSNLTTSGVRSQQVDDLDTSLQNFGSGGLVNESGCIGVNGGKLDTFDGSSLIDGLTDNVHDSTEGLGTDGDGDGCASVDNLLTSNETIGTFHGDTSTGVLTQVLGHFEDESTTFGSLLVTFELNVEGVQNGGQVGGVELNIDNGTNDGLDLTDGQVGGGSVGSLGLLNSGRQGNGSPGGLSVPQQSRSRLGSGAEQSNVGSGILGSLGGFSPCQSLDGSSDERHFLVISRRSEEKRRVGSTE
jgi:hypothetical protein